jgi:hypothetical protein
MTARSIEGTSLVTAAVTLGATGNIGATALEVSCAFEGATGVQSSRPRLTVFASNPRGMAQMVIFGKVDQGSTATLVCRTTVDNDSVGNMYLNYRWDGALGIQANTEGVTPSTIPQNQFTRSSFPT